MNNKPSKIEVGFDTPELRNQHIQHIIAEMHKDPQIKKFLTLMKQTYDGNISMEDFKNPELWEKLNIDQMTKKELYNVLREQTDKNTKDVPSKKYTEDFVETHWERMYELGLIVDEKYGIKPIGTEKGEKVYNVSTQMRVGDITRYTHLLSHITVLTKDITYYLEIINNGTCNRLDKKLMEQEHFPDTDDETKKFFSQCRLLDQEYRRLKLRDYLHNDGIRNYLIAYEHHCLKTYTSFLNLGFIGCLYKENDHIPTPMRLIINKGERYARYALAQVKDQFSDIENAIELLRHIKDNKVLFYPLLSELQRGLFSAMMNYEEKKWNKNILYQLTKYENVVETLLHNVYFGKQKP